MDDSVAGLYHVIDDFVPDPLGYLEHALIQPYKSYDFGHCVFHGIAALPLENHCTIALGKKFPILRPHLSFFRKSPLDQQEPNDIHTDIDMGELTAILYLNENPPVGDGTAFWKHKTLETTGSFVPHEHSKEGTCRENFEQIRLVEAKFNRLLVFKSHLFHSRSLYRNWGTGDEARLTQVTFGKQAA